MDCTSLTNQRKICFIRSQVFRERAQVSTSDTFKFPNQKIHRPQDTFKFPKSKDSQTSGLEAGDEEVTTDFWEYTVRLEPGAPWAPVSPPVSSLTWTPRLRLNWTRVPCSAAAAVTGAWTGFWLVRSDHMTWILSSDWTGWGKLSSVSKYSPAWPEEILKLAPSHFLSLSLASIFTASDLSEDVGATWRPLSLSVTQGTDGASLAPAPALWCHSWERISWHWPLSGQ